MIPETLGGRLVSRAICRDCNNGPFEEADRAVRDFPWVAERIGRLEIKGKRGRLVKPRSFTVELAGGEKLVLGATPQGVAPVPRPAPTGEPGELVVPESFKDAVLQSKKRKGLKASIEGMVDVSGLSEDEMVGQVRIDPSAWPRFAAKVALGLLSLICREDWLDDPDATALQGLVRAESGEVAVLTRERLSTIPEQLSADNPKRRLVSPDHLLTLGRAADGSVALVMILLGDLRYGMTLPGEPLLRGGIDLNAGIHWLVMPGKPCPREPLSSIGLVSLLAGSRLGGGKPDGAIATADDMAPVLEAIDLSFDAGFLTFSDDEQLSSQSSETRADPECRGARELRQLPKG